MSKVWVDEGPQMIGSLDLNEDQVSRLVKRISNPNQIKVETKAKLMFFKVVCLIGQNDKKLQLTKYTKMKAKIF